MMRIAILGCGNIGREIAVSLRDIGGVEVAGLYDSFMDRAFDLSKETDSRVYKNMEELLSDDSVQLVLEAASTEAVKAHGRDILESGKHILVMSVGAFADDLLYVRMKETALKKGVTIYIPSGAIAGIDGLKAAMCAGLEHVTLTTRKNPENFDLTLAKETVLYEGPARDGIRMYPRNVNVAATLSLAGIGLERTTLRIIADPRVDRNIHEIRIEGVFGELDICVKNLPSPGNPKTSYLAVLSALETIKGIMDPVKIGT